MTRPQATGVISLILTAIVATACGSSAPTPIVIYATAPASPLLAPSSAPSGDKAAPPSEPVPTVAPSASLDSAALKTAAGKAYLAVAGRYNKANDALARKYRTFRTLTRARAYYKKSAKLDRAFSDGIRLIVFPPEMSADIKSLLAKNAALESAEIEGSGVRSWADVASVFKAVERTSRSASAAANLVRQDLGLPSVPK